MISSAPPLAPAPHCPSGPGRVAIVSAIVLKDLRDVARDRLWMVMAPASLAMVIALFWILPARVDEAISVGIHAPGLSHAARALEALGRSRQMAEQGLRLVLFETRDELRAAVSGESVDDVRPAVSIGVALPAGEDIRPPALGVLDLFLDLLELPLGGHGAHIDLMSLTHALAEVLGLLDDELRELLRDGLLHVDPLDRGADLPRVGTDNHLALDPILGSVNERQIQVAKRMGLTHELVANQTYPNTFHSRFLLVLPQFQVCEQIVRHLSHTSTFDQTYPPGNRARALQMACRDGEQRPLHRKRCVRGSLMRDLTQWEP